MDNGKITIVTGFFDCKRSDHPTQARSNDLYFEYFEAWARIRNDMIIYGSQEDVERAYEIRRKYGLSASTTVVPIENIYSVESDIFLRMCEIDRRGDFRKWRARPQDISNSPHYSFVTFSRFWALNDAYERGYLSGQVAWVDFGWNHGGRVFVDNNDFDFLWSYEFSNKINLFSLRDIDDYVGVIQIQNMEDTIMAGLFVLPCKMVTELYKYTKEALLFLLALDCYDDDQMYLRIAYKMHPEAFDCHISSWFLPMKEYGGAHMRVREIESYIPQKESWKAKTKSRIRYKIKRFLRYLDARI